MFTASLIEKQVGELRKKAERNEHSVFIQPYASVHVPYEYESNNLPKTTKKRGGGGGKLFLGGSSPQPQQVNHYETKPDGL